MLLVTVSVLRVCLLVQATYFSYVVVVVVVVDVSFCWGVGSSLFRIWHLITKI